MSQRKRIRFGLWVSQLKVIEMEENSLLSG